MNCVGMLVDVYKNIKKCDCCIFPRISLAIAG